MTAPGSRLLLPLGGISDVEAKSSVEKRSTFPLESIETVALVSIGESPDGLEPAEGGLPCSDIELTGVGLPSMGLVGVETLTTEGLLIVLVVPDSVACWVSASTRDMLEAEGAWIPLATV